MAAMLMSAELSTDEDDEDYVPEEGEEEEDMVVEEEDTVRGQGKGTRRRKRGGDLRLAEEDEEDNRRTQDEVEQRERKVEADGPDTDAGKDVVKQKTPAMDPVDALWREMKAGARGSKVAGLEHRSNAKKARVVDPLATWLNSSSVKQSEGGKGDLQREPGPASEVPIESDSKVDSAQKAAKPTDELDSTKTKTRMGPSNSGNLGELLSSLKGKKQSVFAKSREDWVSFKKDACVEEELEAHKKDKDRYTEKMAFLQRSEWREWAFEQRSKR
mmetsp:Transcript_8988/g.18134  ORF Transcript_8988/g.18134 Transcript_8988/m.18134 type:complete len:272 (-) Transcript_8988:225-1040(-)